MASPCRRSARLKGAPPSTEVWGSGIQTPTKLSSVMGSPEIQESVSDPIVSTTACSTLKPTTPLSHSKPSVKTPNSTSPLRPPLVEMHPSKVQRSTSKPSNSARRLGLLPSQEHANGQKDFLAIAKDTPAKVKLPQCDGLNSPSFAFKFSCEDSQLSFEARKLMENIREDAARIKAQMVSDHQSRQAQNDGDTQPLIGARKIATAKGKAGRFSAAHMAEFKKMDSIAGHASSLRAQLGRLNPGEKSLKRTSSKACLDEPEKRNVIRTPTTISPAKNLLNRTRNLELGYTSRSRTMSGSNRNSQKPDPKTRPAPLRSVTTPTKASLLRSSSVKSSRTAMEPFLRVSGSTKSHTAPRTQTDFNPKLKNGLPSLGNLKSILRKHQPLFSNDPVKIAAGTHLASPSFKANSMRGADAASIPDLNIPVVKKHVDFTASTKYRHDFPGLFSPPFKIPAPHNTTCTDPREVAYPSLLSIPPPHGKEGAQALDKIVSQTIRQVSSCDIPSPRKAFQNHPSAYRSRVSGKRRREEEGNEGTQNEVAAASPFDEPSSKRLKLNPKPPSKFETPSTIKHRSVQHATPGSGTPSRSAKRGRACVSQARLKKFPQQKVHH